MLMGCQRSQAVSFTAQAVHMCTQRSNCQALTGSQVVQVLLALQYLHLQGFGYRDLKPTSHK